VSAGRLRPPSRRPLGTGPAIRRAYPPDRGSEPRHSRKCIADRGGRSWKRVAENIARDFLAGLKAPGPPLEKIMQFPAHLLRGAGNCARSPHAPRGSKRTTRRHNPKGAPNQSGSGALQFTLTTGPPLRQLVPPAASRRVVPEVVHPPERWRRGGSNRTHDPACSATARLEEQLATRRVEGPRPPAAPC